MRTTHVHYAKATIFGHPIHPMLVGFPIALYTVGLVTLIVYAVGGELFWYRVAMYAWIAGAAIAVLAAVFGMIDLFAGVPRESRARRTGTKHFALNVLTTILFAAGGLMLYARWYQPVQPPSIALEIVLPLILGSIGMLLTIIAGALGWKLVQTHHVGVEEPATSP
jgi:uncharacterized membrane protein